MKVTTDKAIELIRSGDVVAIPTETVYGLAADARNPLAIEKTFRLKGRPQDNPLIIHISKTEQLYDFAADVPKAALKLAEKLWPGPLTIVLKKKVEVLDAITAGLPTVALRMPDHPAALQIIDACGPLTAPSANKSGRPSPTKPDHIVQDYGTAVAWVDGGETDIGIESTVLNLSERPFTILRPGKIGSKEISNLIQEEILTETGKQKLAASPGTRYSHYKPNATVRWLNKNEKPGDKENALYLCHTDNYTNIEMKNVVHFNGNYSQFAMTLYDLFRSADINNFREVVIEIIHDNIENTISSALLNRIEKAVLK